MGHDGMTDSMQQKSMPGLHLLLEIITDHRSIN